MVETQTELDDTPTVSTSTALKSNNTRVKKAAEMVESKDSYDQMLSYKESHSRYERYSRTC